MTGMVWVLIPLAAILVGAFSEYLKFKAKQQNITASTSEIERALEKMTDQNTNLTRRVQNLEAIVTSQTWDEMDSQTSSSPKLTLPEPEVEIPTDADNVAELARRVRS
jgi:hypothetical protein